MKVRDRQQVRATRLEPFGTFARLALGAVAVAARVVGDELVPTSGIAFLHVPAELGCAAGSDCVQDALLSRRHTQTWHDAVGIGQAADDVGHLEGRPIHATLSSGSSCREDF